MTAKNVGLTSTNAEVRGFIDQNLSPTKGKYLEVELLGHMATFHLLHFQFPIPTHLQRFYQKP